MAASGTLPAVGELRGVEVLGLPGPWQPEQWQSSIRSDCPMSGSGQGCIGSTNRGWLGGQQMLAEGSCLDHGDERHPHRFR